MLRSKSVKDFRHSSAFLRKRNVFRSKQKECTERVCSSTRSRKWEWYDPPEDSAPVHFFLNTSLHGLRYLGERKRHVCERVFWLTAFIAATVTSAVLIWHMWDGYVTMPIVTVFNPTEKTLAEIPFPAVTICSVNNLKKSKWEQLQREARRDLQNGGVPNETLLRKFASILDIIHICHSAKSFTERFYNVTRNGSDPLYATMIKHLHQFVPYLDAVETLRNSSQTCSEMILFCLWHDGVKKCNDLFQQVETDYGYCCTFNMIPLTLLRTFVRDPIDDPERVKDWEKADLNYENLLFDENNKHRKYPYRQLYAGRSAGLSILVDPDMEEYHCTNTDSEGFLVGLNVPLDFPRMKDNGIAIRTSTETFLSVLPEITLSAPSARNAKQEKRHCYFEGEKTLTYYSKYTSSNCLDECIAKKTLKQCQCLRYYMPRSNNSEEVLCRPDKFHCTESVRGTYIIKQCHEQSEILLFQLFSNETMIEIGLDNVCDNCWPACSEIIYHTEVTSLRIRESQVQTLYDFANITLGSDRAKNASIKHIFFSVDSVFPRLRKEMTTVIDLISNADGLLGLCMGFSMLSLLEILYHVTIRVCCNNYRERYENKITNLANGDLQIIQPSQNSDSFANWGFFSRIMNRGSLPRSGVNHDIKNEEALFKLSNGQKSTLPPYFQTSFEADFRRAHVATTWIPQQPNFVNGAGTIKNSNMMTMEEMLDVSKKPFYYE